MTCCCVSFVLSALEYVDASCLRKLQEDTLTCERGARQVRVTLMAQDVLDVPGAGGNHSMEVYKEMPEGTGSARGT